MSKYNELHDKFSNIATNKAGTKYERLTAIVFKILEKNNTVIHDMKLIGNTKVKHQIDVVINENESKKRILLECKDFDESGKKVGLGIIRNFFAVAEDIKPNKSIVVTCNGFTKEAKKYAKAKEIKLVILRKVKDEDLNKFIMQIAIDLDMVERSTPNVSFAINKEKDNKPKINTNIIQASYRNTNVFITNSHGRKQINEFISEIINNNKQTPQNDTVKISLTLYKTFINILDQGEFPLKRVSIEYKLIHHHKKINITPDKVAELILIGVNGSDLLIFDKDLRSYDIEEKTGKVFKVNNSFVKKIVNNSGESN